MTMLRFLFAVLSAVVASTVHGTIARAEIQGQYVDYTHGETPLSGYLTYDDSLDGTRPGVLLVHARSGLTERAREDARMFARMGYVVFATDMFGKGVVPQTVPEMVALSGLYNNVRQLMRARAQAGLDVLSASPMVDSAKLAVVGYCFGGTVAIELAESGAPLLGVIPVHGSFHNFTPEDANNIQGSVLILHGAEDQTATLEDVNDLIADLRAAEVEWQLALYSGAEHGFTNPGSPAEERADREYKAASERFLAEIFAD
jgi:dienelactone hydrolase